MNAQDTARAIFQQWGELHDADPDLPDKLMSALRAEFFREAAAEVAATPLPTFVLAAEGRIPEMARRCINNAAKRLRQLAESGPHLCPPGTHSTFESCPGTCNLPTVEGC